MRSIILSLTAGAVVAGCCTDMGCVGIIEVGLESPRLTGDLGAEYTFDIAVDDRMDSCTGVVGESFECTGGWVVAFTDDANPTTPTALTGSSGQRIDEITLRVERERQAVFDDTFDADGEAFFPNGRTCPGACESFQGIAAW